MIGWTFCSGIGAPECAAPWVDWRLASEVEKFPRAVLQERFGYVTPEDHNQGEPLLWADMSEITPDLARSRGVPLPNIVVAGTPCQAFSVAGLRKGTADARGNLTLKFVEILHDLVAARPDGKLAVLWENVPGVLSDKGNAFGCFLGGLVGAVDALRAPGGGSWPGEGMVSGPRARAAWAVLDAQYFGVAQRRRRVFVVVDFGGACDPAAVLLEPESLRGHPPARGKAGQVVAALTSAGVGTCGTDDNQGQAGHLIAEGVALRGREGGATAELTGPLAMALRASQGGGDKPHVMVASTGDIAHCLNAGGMGRIDYETETMVAHALRGEGFDASEDGTGRGTPIVPVCFSSKDYGADALSDLPPTLRAGGHDGSHANAGVPPAVAFHNRQDPDVSGEGTHPLGAKDNGLGVMTNWAVRRLTPTECERLQGFPDGHTAITHRGKPAADGPRYRALGNSMAVPVISWIMLQMKGSMDRMRANMGDPAQL